MTFLTCGRAWARPSHGRASSSLTRHRATERLLHARKDCLRLLDRFDLVESRLLPDVKILDDKITLPMEVGKIVRQRLELCLRRRQITLRCLGIKLRPLNRFCLLVDQRGQSCDFFVGVLDKGLVPCLRRRFTLHFLSLGLFRVLDDLLDETHHRRGPSVLLVGGELHRRRLLLEESGVTPLLRLVYGRKLVERLFQDNLRGPLVSDHLLVLCVLGLAVRGRCELLFFSLGDTLCSSGDLLVQLLDESSKGLNFSLEVLLLLSLLVRHLLVRVELRIAEELELHLLLLFCLQIGHHLVHRSLYLCERVELYGDGERGKLLAGPAGAGCWTAGAAPLPGRKKIIEVQGGILRGSPERRGGGHAGASARGGLLLQQRHALRQQLPIVVVSEDGQGLVDGHDLVAACLTPQGPLVVKVVTDQLEILEELNVLGPLVPGQIQQFLSVDEQLLVGEELGLVLVQLLLRELNVLLQLGHVLLVILDTLPLLLLNVGQLRLEVFFHLFEDAHDDTRPRDVGARVRRGLLHEGRTLLRLKACRLCGQILIRKLDWKLRVLRGAASIEGG